MAQYKQIASVRSSMGESGPTTKVNRHSKIHIPLIIAAALLVIYGLIVDYSATFTDIDYNFSRQAMGVGLGIIFMVLVWRMDYRQLSGYVVFFLVLDIVLIMSPHIPFIGVESNGALSWVKIGPISFQPGEFAKVGVILLCASVMARYGGRMNDVREYLKALVIMGIPFVCVLTQPDMGTGMVYLFIAGVALIMGGARPKFILITVGIMAGAIVGLFTLDPIADAIVGHDVLLKEYQRSRLLVFLDPSYDPTGNGYNLIQAQIAIGSGGFFGKGFMNATQSTLGFLPEAPTDFVFCVLAEEFGFVGAMVLLAMYAFLIYQLFQIARQAGDLFGTVIVMCIAGMWLFQIFENIGMDIGLMPITGIPLPFVSYGSSFMMMNFICLGLVGSVWAHNGR